MIQATELRIGNWIKLQSDTETIIRGGGINAIEVDMLEVSPIPLTEEWLLKFGFEQYLLIWRYKGFTIAGSLNNGYGLTGYCIENIFPINCLYVHQLQNLYFALTNEELTIEKLL